MIAEVTRQAGQSLQPDEELVTVRRLLQAARTAGIRADRKAIVNTYVSLKSRPFLILTGEKQTGKIELVKRLGHVLTEIPARQCQLFVGHARWAAQSQNVAHFVEMQDRFNRNNLLSLIEEACQRGNENRLFIACLTRISPAELHEYFSTPGFQFWPERARIEGAPASAPVPYPPNFRLLGTMDSARFNGWDADLLARTTVIGWAGKRLQSKPGKGLITDISSLNRHFLQTRVPSEQAAYARLQHILSGQRHALLPFMQALDLIYRHNVTLPHEVIGRVIRYLANSWTDAGEGLFDPMPLNNLNQALDLALAQYILPWIAAVQSEPARLLTQLEALFNGQFNQAAIFISALTGRLSLPGNHQPNYV